ncbi:hypothetical protein [Sorangium cellulosum]|uniref:hypothetical protein n=1 Tax=Sorangium cellulosum TaxID=56 RepID=UPI0006782ABD|nr:hypothetical protein [Sorangium cellulosum]
MLVDRPDFKGREDILRVHVRRLKLAEGVDLGIVAQRTSGMVGADLANAVNEAALAAARRGSALVEQRDFEEAIDRIQLGLKKRGRAMNEEEKRRVAFHEAGPTRSSRSRWSTPIRCIGSRSSRARSARSARRSSCRRRIVT